MKTKYLAFVLFGACTFGGSDASTPQLVSTESEPAGANCANGGVAIHTGLDENGNGQLDASEITSTSYVCSGANGTDGTNGTNGTDGTNGSNGTNGSDGSNGSNGSNGSDGYDQLVKVVGEQPGANCATGGQAIEIGYDTDRDGVLENSEVTQTSYVCNPANQKVHDGDYTITGAGETYLLIGVEQIHGKLTINALDATSIDVSSLQAVDGGIQVLAFGGSSMSFSSLQTTAFYDSEVNRFAVSFPHIQHFNSLYAFGNGFSADALTTVSGNAYITGLSSDVVLPALTSTGALDVESDSGVFAFSAPALAQAGDVSASGMNLDLPALTTASSVWLQNGMTSFSAPQLAPSGIWVELDDTQLSTLGFDPSIVTDWYVGANPNFAFSSPVSSISTLWIYGDVASIDFPNLASASYLDVDSTMSTTQISFPSLGTASEIYISENAALSNVSFPVLESVGYAYIRDNAALPECQADQIAAVASSSNVGNNSGTGACP